MFRLNALVSTAMLITVLVVLFHGLIAWKAMITAFMLVAVIWLPWLMFTMIPFQRTTREMLARVKAFNLLDPGSGRERAEG